MKIVLSLSASPCKGGTSDTLCDQFAKGAAEAGHNVEKIRLAERNGGHSEHPVGHQTPARSSPMNCANQSMTGPMQSPRNREADSYQS